MPKKSISCEELKERLQSGDELLLIDVRQPEEFELSRIEGSILIPFEELEDHIQDFEVDETVVIHCKYGKQSLEAQQHFNKAGFSNVHVLEGGILQWIKKFDQRLGLYYERTDYF